MTNTEALNLLKELQENTTARPAYHRAIQAAIEQLERAVTPPVNRAPDPLVGSAG